MKKSLLLSALVLGASSMMLTGFDSAATPEEILEKYAEASTSLTQAAIDMDMNFGFDMSAALPSGESQDLSMGIVADLTGATQITDSSDPSTLSAKLEGNMSVNAMEEQEQMDMSVYVVPNEEGGLDTFAKVTGEDWEYAALPGDQLKAQFDQIMEMMNGNTFDLSALPGTFTLGEEAVDVNGVSCYQLLLNITYSDLEPMITEAMAAAGETVDEATMSLVSMVLSGFQFNMEFDINAETYQLAKMRMDMDGSDLTALSSILSYSMADTDEDGNMILPELSMNISNAYIEAVYDYSADVDFTVPEEALAAKENSDGDDVANLAELGEDLMSAAEDTVEQ